MLLITVILMDILTGMEFDLFVPSFPQLQNHFHLSPFLVEALLSVNFIGYCLSLFFVGGLSDRFGRKPIILVGIITFIVGGFLCFLAKSYSFLLLGRFLQGLGIAAPAILSFVIIADAYPIKKQQFLLAMLNGSMNVATAIAPVIGSYIALYFHWQGNFIALTILGIITLLMTQLFIPKNELPTIKKSFLLKEYFQILKSKPLMLLIINLLFVFVPYWIFVGMSPLLYIKDLKVSLAHFGYYQGVLALIFALGSVFYGWLIRDGHYDQKKMLYIAMAMLSISLLIMSLITLSNSINPLIITLGFIPFIIAQVIPTTIIYPICLNFMPEAKGRVSAVIQAGRLIFSAIGLQVASFFYVGSFQNIGLVMMAFILFAVITLWWVIRNSHCL